MWHITRHIGISFVTVLEHGCYIASCTKDTNRSSIVDHYSQCTALRSNKKVIDLQIELNICGNDMPQGAIDFKGVASVRFKAQVSFYSFQKQ